MNKLVALCFCLTFLLSFYEFMGVLKARVAGQTKATSRVVLRGIIFFAVGLLLWQHLEWQAYLSSFAPANLDDVRLDNIPFLVCSAALGAILLLILFEVVSLIGARRKGLTQNSSRLVTSFVIFFALLPVLKETVDMWDRYTHKLENYLPPRSE